MKMKKVDSINVIPFIDIMLVLFVMVITTATFIKQGVIPVDLPDAKSSDKKEQKKDFNIYVTKDAKIFIDKQEVDKENLENILAKVPKDQTIVLRSDKESKFQDFVLVMDTLKKLNHEQLFIVTKE